MIQHFNGKLHLNAGVSRDFLPAGFLFQSFLGHIVFWGLPYGELSFQLNLMWRLRNLQLLVEFSFKAPIHLGILSFSMNDIAHNGCHFPSPTQQDGKSAKASIVPAARHHGPEFPCKRTLGTLYLGHGSPRKWGGCLRKYQQWSSGFKEFYT